MQTQLQVGKTRMGLREGKGLEKKGAVLGLASMGRFTRTEKENVRRDRGGEEGNLAGKG